jgi:hypothetical protein
LLKDTITTHSEGRSYETTDPLSKKKMYVFLNETTAVELVKEVFLEALQIYLPITFNSYLVYSPLCSFV